MIDQLQEQLNTQLAVMEDGIVENRIDHMLEKEGIVDDFHEVFLSAYKPNEETADNYKQRIRNFLMDKMDVNG